MRQVWVAKAGSADQLELREMPDPTPRNGEVRIRVEASGVSFLDILGRLGRLREGSGVPFVPGVEVAGTVDAVGQGVTAVREGDQVMALTHFGGYSDLVCLPYRQVFRRLDWMSAEDGAALPVDYLTAYLCLVAMGGLRAGERVLIHNVSGGVGLAALDISRIVGAESFGTASPYKHDGLAERGLVHAIDYRNWDYARVVGDLTNGEGVDLILDPLGGIHWQKNYALLRAGGRLVYTGESSVLMEEKNPLTARIRRLFTLPRYSPLDLMEDNKGVLGFNLLRLLGAHWLIRPAMEQLVEWYDEALFRPRVDRTFLLERAPDAHLFLEARKNVGKVLLTPTASSSKGPPGRPPQ